MHVQGNVCKYQGSWWSEGGSVKGGAREPKNGEAGRQAALPGRAAAVASLQQP